MFFYIKHHINKILIMILFILLGCQLQEPVQNHGILFLENRANKLDIKNSNKNDALKVLGQPHTKSMTNEDQWIYIERTLSKGKFHKLGQNVIKTSNVLVLSFDKYGILIKKDLYNKEDIKKRYLFQKVKLKINYQKRVL